MFKDENNKLVFIFEKLLKLNLKFSEDCFDDYTDAFCEAFDKAKSTYLSFPTQLVELNPILEDEIKNYLYNKCISSCNYDSKFYCISKDGSNWLSEIKDNIQWNQRDLFFSYLNQYKNFSSKAIKKLDEFTDALLEKLKNPNIPNPFKVKGLMMGEVQSGKTNTFISLCHKSIDVGWKFIIILTGMTNDLRQQTQERIDFDLIGVETKNNKKEIVGIGKDLSEYFNKCSQFTNLTSFDDDFDSSLYKKTDNSVLIAVCKKNSLILNKFIKWLKNSKENLKEYPCILIDDEADQASPNAKKDDLDIATVNFAIRNLLDFFTKQSYLAVTATPYANIFINPQLYEFNSSYQNDFLIDLFPRDFIFAKESPNGYVGVKELFGLKFADDCNINKLQDQIVIPLAKNQEEIFNLPIKKNSYIDKLPPSLIESLRYFFCCCVYKSAMHVDSHTSMLVHIDFRKENHLIISELISDFLLNEIAAIQSDRGLSEDYLKHQNRYLSYKKIWEESCQRKDFKYKAENFYNLSKIEFKEVWKKYLLLELEKINIKTINSNYKGESLVSFYKNNENSRLIAVGGYSLGRGITLEGLCVTYLSRKSTAIDTLLQMGRFFGYRLSCIHFMKIWMTETIEKMYEDAAKAQEEFVSQVKTMNQIGDATPLNFGFKIHCSPANLKLRLAAKNKMKHCTEIVDNLNLSGYVVQASKLPRDIRLLKENKLIIANFLNSLKNPQFGNDRNKDIVWKDVPYLLVADLVKSFNAIKWGDYNKLDIYRYIKEKLREISWEVRLVSKNINLKNTELIDFFKLGEKYKIGCSNYTLKKDDGSIYFSKSAVMSGEDLSRRLSKKEYFDLKQNTKGNLSSVDILSYNYKTLPVQLLIYAIEPNESNSKDWEEYSGLICSMVIGVPSSSDIRKMCMKYYANDIYMEMKKNKSIEY